VLNVALNSTSAVHLNIFVAYTSGNLQQICNGQLIARV